MGVETKRQIRYRKTTNDFIKWLGNNPTASKVRKVGAFNKIADRHYDLSTKGLPVKGQRKLIKRI